MGQDRLAGRVALVTGASRGIGLATARALRDEGCRVALVARGKDELEAAASEFGDSGIAIQADVSQSREVADLVERAAGQWGRLDVLVNNAAIGRVHRIEDASDEDLATQVSVNVLGPLYTIRAAIPHLRAAGGGDIVNVSSDSVRRPFPFLVAYAATKGALETLTEGLREEVSGDGIRATVVRSGPALTSFAAGWDPDTATRAFARWQEDSRLDPSCVVAPEAIANAIVHVLCQPREATVHVLDLRPSFTNT